MAETDLAIHAVDPALAASPWPVRDGRSRNHSVKRDAVIRAAARAFSAHGYHHTSLDEVAEALNVSKPTIYYYVANKEQLLFECFVAGLAQIQSAIRKAAKSNRSAHDRLKDVIRNYALAIASEYGWCMVRAEDQDLGPKLSRQIKALKSEIDRGLRRLLIDGMRDGSIQQCDPKMMAFALAGALNWIAHWYRENKSMSAAQIADAFVEVFSVGLIPRKDGANSAPRVTSRKRRSTKTNAR